MRDGEAGLSLRWGTVREAGPVDGGLQEVTVDLGAGPEPAYALPVLSGVLERGQEVLVNTTAVELGLGTGGRHVVLAVRDRELLRRRPGHLLKLRYTPLQFVPAMAEEPGGDGPALAAVDSLAGLPVVVGGLHSQLAAAAAGAKAASAGRARVVYLMTDGGSLPLGVSRLVKILRQQGLIDATVTAGQAFGGDFEAINVHSALLIARTLAGADVVVAVMGPGIAGSGLPFGHTGLEQGEVLNAVAALDGEPVAILRVSEADPRERHRGLSHHTRTALGRVALVPAWVVVPEDSPLLSEIRKELDGSGIAARHRIIQRPGEPGVRLLAERGVAVTTMGRSPAEDPSFFLAASAAGFLAGEFSTRRGTMGYGGGDTVQR